MALRGGSRILFSTSFRGKITYLLAVFAVSFSGILGAISMIPGGVGIADGTIYGILIWSGIDKPIAGVVTLVSRFSTMWLGVFLGCAVVLLFKTVAYVHRK